MLGPALLASWVLQQNQSLLQHKRRSHLGFPATFPQQFTTQNIGGIDDDFYMDHAGTSGPMNDNDTIQIDSPTMMDFDDEFSGHNVEQSKCLENISELNNDFI